MLLANFDRKEHLQHRAVSLRQHGFLVSFLTVLNFALRSSRKVCITWTLQRRRTGPSSVAVLGKIFRGGWPLVIWEATDYKHLNSFYRRRLACGKVAKLGLNCPDFWDGGLVRFFFWGGEIPPGPNAQHRTATARRVTGPEGMAFPGYRVLAIFPVPMRFICVVGLTGGLWAVKEWRQAWGDFYCRSIDLCIVTIDRLRIMAYLFPVY